MTILKCFLSGPQGSGKTQVANLIARSMQGCFIQIFEEGDAEPTKHGNPNADRYINIYTKQEN